jgi:predicted nucleotidyltransferase component of viral defense system
MALIPFDKKYLEQLGLVLEILPWIAKEGSFALKGGTAINLFERGLPRLSVDIDLCYPRISERSEVLSKITSALDGLKRTLLEKLHMLEAVRDSSSSLEYKLLCRKPDASVKIEVNTTMRGCLWPLRDMPIHPKAEEILERYIEMPVISREELFGGKICAALDRQHPRDMFDLQPLVSEEGLGRSVIFTQK